MSDASYENFLTTNTFANPREILARARVERPVFLTHNAKGDPVYVVTTYQLVRQVFQDKENFNSDYMHLQGQGSGNAEADTILEGTPHKYSEVINVLLNTDGKRHDRLRSLVNPLFSMGAVNALIPTLEPLAHSLIDNFIESGECDLIADFAIPLSLKMLLGAAKLDPAIVTRAIEWSDAVMLRMGHLGTPEQEVEAAKLIVEMHMFLHQQILDRRANPQDDLISHLITAHVDGEPPLSDKEILAFLNEIIVAGNESTRHTMVAGIVLLLRHPDQLALLSSNPELMPNAVEEVLRYHSTGSGIWRKAVKDVRLGDVDIPAGSTLMLRMDSANHDDAQFSNAANFDIQRKNAKTGLFFGYGSHFCLGQFLARKEVLVALKSLLGRLQNLRLDEEKSDLRRQAHILIHALREVHIKFDPGERLSPVFSRQETDETAMRRAS